MAAIEVEAIVAGLAESSQPHEVLIDGQRCGIVQGGETRSFEVPPGIHSIRLELDSHSSPSVKVVVGFGKTSVVCQTAPRRFLGFATATLDTQILVREERESSRAVENHIAWQARDELAQALRAHAAAD